MKTVSLCNDNIEDAKSVIRDRFSASACDLLDRELQNPYLNTYPHTGDIVYDDDGTPICFQANIPRRVYLGQCESLGVVGGTTCRKKNSPPEAYVDIRAAANQYLKQGLIGFGNSCNAESAAAQLRVSKKKNATGFIGPESCARYLWRAVRPLECLSYFVRRKVLKAETPNWTYFSTLSSAGYSRTITQADNQTIIIRRLMTIDASFFDVLMAEYLKTNKGLFCSRTAEEVEWYFGDRVRDGLVVVLGAFDQEQPVGYIVLDGKANWKRVALSDLFALNRPVGQSENSHPYHELLVKSACDFLKQQTPCMMFETRGFPMWIQPLFQKYLPHVRKIGHNCFAWGTQKKYREELLDLINAEDTWFFSPYDGDEAMC